MSAEKSQKTAIKEGVRYCGGICTMLLLLGGAGGLEHQFRQCPLNGTPGGGNPVWRGPGRDSRCHRMADPSSKDLCGSDFRRRTGSVRLPSSDFFPTRSRAPLCWEFLPALNFCGTGDDLVLGRGMAIGSWAMVAAAFCRFHALHGLRAAGRKKSEPDVHAGGLRCHDQLYLFGCDGLCGDICR